MNTDNSTKAQPQQETPRHNTGQVEERVDDDGVSPQREGDDKKKAKEEATPASTAAVRPGAVALPSTGATTSTSTSTAREPGGIVPQMNQLREPGEVAGPSPTTKKNLDPNMISPFDDSQINMKEKAERDKSQASDATVQPVGVAAENPPVRPGAVAVQGALTQQNTKLRTGPQQPVVQPGAVAVQGPDAAVRSKESTDRASQLHAPSTVVGRATTAKKGSVDPDIESGLLVPASGMVDEKRVNVRAGGVSSGDDVRPGAVVVQAGTTITTQNAEVSAFPAPTMHTPSPNILTSKAAIANRTAAVQGNANTNGAAGVTDGALPVSDKSLEKDESGALSEAAEEPRPGAVAVPAADGMETLDMVRPPSHVGAAVTGDNTAHSVPKVTLVTAYTVNEVDQEAILYKARVAIEADVREEMTTKVVHAEIVDEPEVDQPHRRRRCQQFSLLALAVIVAAVVGGVVASQSGGGPKAPPSMAPSMSASISVAPSATPSAAPSSAPSVAPFQGTYHG
jgi:surface protein